MPAYRLTSAAADDLSAIFLDGLRMFGIAQADRYHDGLTATLEFLVEYPRAAREREEISPPVRAYTYMAHVIVYEIDAGDEVTILRGRHGREDWLSDGYELG